MRGTTVLLYSFCIDIARRRGPGTRRGPKQVNERQWVAVQRTSATSTTERRRRWDSVLGQRSSCCSSTKPTISSGSRARMLHLASPAHASTRVLAAYAGVQSCVLISPAVCMPPSAPRFRSGVRRCVDLCAAPGSWSQARRRRVNAMIRAADTPHTSSTIVPRGRGQVPAYM